MAIKQLSVFLENRSGRLAEMTKILGNANINLAALSIAETSDFGIIRMIVSNPEEGLKILKENNFSVSLTEVICLSTPNKPGSLAQTLSVLSNHNISIEYMYAFSLGEEAYVVMKTDDMKQTVDILNERNMKLLSSEKLKNI